MSITSVNKLLDELDKDLAWRKKELSYILNLVEYTQTHTSSKNIQISFIRIGVAILYAHWEGFIKNGSIKYLEFISMQGLNYSELNPNFIAFALKSKIIECGQTKKTSMHNNLVVFLMNNLTDKAEIESNDIDTESNLSSKVLKEILYTLGLDYSPYELKAKLIDSKLVKIRNDIAHGQYTFIDISDFRIIFKEIMDLINIFKDQIIDAAKSESYKSPKS